jgi:predicted membrane protein
MTNFVLFLSSVFITFIHVAAQLRYQQSNFVLTVTMACGCVTSVWNHGVTSSIAKAVDRLMMWIGFFSNLYTISRVHDNMRRYACLITLLAAVLLYVVAKSCIALSRRHQKQEESNRLSDLPHILAHFSLTITHILLMESQLGSLDRIT